LGCKVYENWIGFYFTLVYNGEFFVSEYNIADFLELAFEEYIDLVMQNGGFQNREKSYHYFRTKEKCQDFIEKFIEPRLIMEELIK